VTAAHSPLRDWLERLERINPDRVELGLDRVDAVWQQLRRAGHRVPGVITIAGTNGKGSSGTMLASILQAAGYRVGLYSSPHLVRFTERIRIDGAQIEPTALVAAFEAIDACDGADRLTYFEWATLAAFVAFSRAGLDVWVLEVGLGGRLDAVNILDADLALITNISLDHTAMLGRDRASIAREKAGILRPGQPAVYADPEPVPALIEQADAAGVPLRVQGRDYQWHASQDGGFVLRIGAERQYWPAPGLRGRHQLANAAAIVALLRQADAVRLFPQVDERAIEEGLRSARIEGRCESFAVDGRTVILDVAHNPEGVRALRDCLAQLPPARHLAVFSALADKDVEVMIGQIPDTFSAWHVGRIDSPRAGDPVRIVQAIRAQDQHEVNHETKVTDAYTGALAQSKPGDRIVVFGSFLVVGAIRDLILQEGGRLG